MAPEIIDLTVEDDNDVLLEDLQEAASRAVKAQARVQQHLNRPLNQAKSEPKTPMKSGTKSDRSKFSGTPSRLRTPIKSSDNVIPLSLRKINQDRPEDQSTNPSSSHFSSPLQGAAGSKVNNVISLDGRALSPSKRNQSPLRNRRKSSYKTPSTPSQAEALQPMSQRRTSGYTSKRLRNHEEQLDNLDLALLGDTREHNQEDEKRLDDLAIASLGETREDDQKDQRSLDKTSAADVAEPAASVPTLKMGRDLNATIGSALPAALSAPELQKPVKSSPYHATSTQTSGIINYPGETPLRASRSNPTPMPSRAHSTSSSTPQTATTHNGLPGSKAQPTSGVISTGACANGNLGVSRNGPGSSGFLKDVPHSPKPRECILAGLDSSETGEVKMAASPGGQAVPRVDHSLAGLGNEGLAAVTLRQPYEGWPTPEYLDTSTALSFPPGFDRGRFPKERRRRGSKKHSLPRINGSSKPFGIYSSERAEKAVSHMRDSKLAASKKLDAYTYDLSDVYTSHDTEEPSSPFKARSTSKEPPGSPQVSYKERHKPIRQHGGAALTERSQYLRWPLKDTEGVTEFFLYHVAPTVERQSELFTPLLFKAERSAINRSIVTDALNNDLLEFLQNNDFSTSKSQRKRIKKHISMLYALRVDKVLKRRQDSDQSLEFERERFPWNEIPSKASRTKSYQLAHHAPRTADRVEDSQSASNSQNGSLHRASLPLPPTYPSSNGTVFPAGTVRETLSAGSQPTESAGQQLYASLDHAFTASKPELIKGQGIQDHSKTSSSSESTTSRDKIGDSSSAKPPRKSKSLARGPRPVSFRNEKAVNVRNAAIPHPVSDPSMERPLVAKPHKAQSAQTFDNPYIEHQIAKAALEGVPSPLKEMPSASSMVQRKVRIAQADQDQLLNSSHIAKGTTGDSRGQKLTMVQGRVVDPVARPERQIQALLRHRELGSGARSLRSSDLQLRVLEKLRPWKKWKGASSDIVSVAWNSDSTTYAVGAAAHTNAEDLQYNRPCNLMLGNLHSNKLWELPDHRTERPTPNTISQGPNSSQETYDACDPLVYQTVNSVTFSRDGKRMYTASRDHTVKVWDTFEGRQVCNHTLDHGAVVSGLDVFRETEVNIFVTASQKIDQAIRVYQDSGTHVKVLKSFSSSRAKAQPNLRILPECIRWGPTFHNRHLLLAGFSQWENLGRDDLARKGQLCLWDVAKEVDIKIAPSSQSVTAVAWHPSLPLFVAGGAPGGSVRSNKSRSVVRTYDARSLTRYQVEFESTARDIQDVTHHPLDPNIVTAGCTDGTSFVWDYRRHDKPVHCLRHGMPLMELDGNLSRAESDTGVRLSLWGPEGGLYYTGSSDGVVKAWDVRRHPADVLIRDVAHVGAAIQDGAFSPDFSHLLVGDADGGVHILSSAPCGPTVLHDSDDESADGEPIQLERAPDGSGRRLDPNDDNPGTEGIETARKLVDTGQLRVHPVYGPGQGEYYRGPFAKDSQRMPLPTLLSEETSRKQVFDQWGVINKQLAAERVAYTDMRKSLLNGQKDTDKAIVGRLKPENTQNALDRQERRPYECDFDTALPFSQRVTVVSGPFSSPMSKGIAVARDLSQAGARQGNLQQPERAKAHRSADQRGLHGAVDNMIPDHEMVEENFWWPRLGEDEISKAVSKT